MSRQVCSFCFLKNFPSLLLFCYFLFCCEEFLFHIPGRYLFSAVSLLFLQTSHLLYFLFSYTLSRPLGVTISVIIGFLPFGISSKIVKSKSPYIVRASVLGIGVAVIERRCGAISSFLTSFCLCAVPKRCCSSMIIKAKFLNFTVFCIRECVPSKIGISPFRTHLRS